PLTRTRATIAAMLGVLFAAFLGSAPGGEPRQPAVLRVSLPIDGAIAAALTAGWLGSETLFKKQLAPDGCRWCASNGLDEWARAPIRACARSGAKAPHPRPHRQQPELLLGPFDLRVCGRGGQRHGRQPARIPARLAGVGRRAPDRRGGAPVENGGRPSLPHRR